MTPGSKSHPSHTQCVEKITHTHTTNTPYHTHTCIHMYICMYIIKYFSLLLETEKEILKVDLFPGWCRSVD